MGTKRKDGKWRRASGHYPEIESLQALQACSRGFNLHLICIILLLVLKNQLIHWNIVVFSLNFVGFCCLKQCVRENNQIIWNGVVLDPTPEIWGSFDSGNWNRSENYREYDSVEMFLKFRKWKYFWQNHFHIGYQMYYRFLVWTWQVHQEP